QIASFALYGFPESHSASFALIAYASAYLKAHHPAAFFCSLLNAWPMGFYHPATLVKDGQRHGVEFRPIDVTRSDWKCTIEDGALRLGMRYVLGLREEAARRLAAGRPRASVAAAAQHGGRRACGRSGRLDRPPAAAHGQGLLLPHARGRDRDRQRGRRAAALRALAGRPQHLAAARGGGTARARRRRDARACGVVPAARGA